MSSRLINFLRRRGKTEILARVRRAVTGSAPLTRFDDAHPLVFCLSTGRVGTATLASLCALAPNVVSVHEPVPRLYRLSRLAWEGPATSAGEEILRAAFLTAREDAMAQALRCGRGYVETSPQATFLAPIIRAAAPEARFVHLVRHPRSVIRSGLARGWYDGNQGDATRIAPVAQSVNAPPWDQISPFSRNLWLWVETNRWIEAFLRSIPAERGLRLRAEELFAGNHASCASLYRFLGTHEPPRHQVRRALARRLNAQPFAGNDGSTWTAQMEAELLSSAAPLLNEFGYRD